MAAVKVTVPAPLDTTSPEDVVTVVSTRMCAHPGPSGRGKFYPNLEVTIEGARCEALQQYSLEYLSLSHLLLHLMPTPSHLRHRPPALHHRPHLPLALADVVLLHHQTCRRLRTQVLKLLKAHRPSPYPSQHARPPIYPLLGDFSLMFHVS